VPSPPKVLRVALDTPLRRLFDYLPPEAPVPLAPGLRVRVPFGRGERVGVLIECAERSELPLARLKRVKCVLDTEPALSADAHALVLFAADYYQHPLGEVYAAALPARLRAGVALEASETHYRAGAPARTRLGPRQAALLAALAGAPLSREAIEARAPGSGPTLATLLKRGLIESLEVPAAARALPARPAAPGPALGHAQTSALEALTAALGRFAPFLLAGITGSGKTEVYLRLIACALAAGRQALVLVPEIALTPQTVERFATRLGVPIALLHSGLSDGERLAMWRAARCGAARVVIGTRSAVFASLPELGVIVVDEEHDSSYKQQEGARYSARDLAVLRARAAGVPVVLGSATPALETLQNVAEGRYLRLELPERAGGARSPTLATIDLRVHAMNGALATPAVLAMERHLGAGGQVLLYLNRRGFAPSLYCPGCAWIAPCPACDARLTVHLRERRLRCHHCGASGPLPFACPRCATELKPVGQGTERVEETLARVFPGVAVLRIDRDTVRGRDGFAAAFAKVRDGSARILLGTQMLAKGHDFPNVSLVVVLDADQGLFSTDFRASERLAQNIIQVAGRAGRADRPGEVLVQSACPAHPLLAKLVAQGYGAFASAALAERRHAGLPPFSHLALIAAEAKTASAPMAALTSLREQAGAVAPVRILGPAPAVLERKADRYRAQLLIESPERRPLKLALERIAQLIEATPGRSRVRLSLEVDPLEVG
jgi:primosomal protein N' (replication factor Y) (superfamily II helicase)